MKERGKRSSKNPTSFEKRFKIRPSFVGNSMQKFNAAAKFIKESIILTTWVVVKEEDRCSEHRGKHSVMEDTRCIDTDEVKEESSDEAE